MDDGTTANTVVFGNITIFTELCEHARLEAFQLMLGHAQEIGANAIIGIRYDANEVMARKDDLPTLIVLCIDPKRTGWAVCNRLRKMAKHTGTWARRSRAGAGWRAAWCFSPAC